MCMRDLRYILKLAYTSKIVHPRKVASLFIAHNINARKKKEKKNTSHFIDYNIFA